MRGQNGTIYNANNGKGNANNGIGSKTNYNSTTNDTSIGETTKGVKVKDTINDIATGKITQGTKPRS
jgi:hypothetical protein